MNDHAKRPILKIFQYVIIIIEELSMPTYEYECKICGHTFDAFQSMSDEPLKSCPQCGKEVRRLIHGGAGVIFKGSGFYVTDKKGSGSSASSTVPAKTQEKGSQETKSQETKSQETTSQVKTGGAKTESASAKPDGGSEKKAAG
jgi:putative FmdB family regulatory protein